MNTLCGTWTNVLTYCKMILLPNAVCLWLIHFSHRFLYHDSIAHCIENNSQTTVCNSETRFAINLICHLHYLKRLREQNSFIVHSQQVTTNIVIILSLLIFMWCQMACSVIAFDYSLSVDLFINKQVFLIMRPNLVTQRLLGDRKLPG